MADVNIKIDIDADTSAIDRVRRKLRDLCREVDDCTGTYEKHTKAIRDMSGAQDEAGRGAGRNNRNFDKNGKSANKLTSMLKKLAMFGFKYLAIEAAAALAVIGSAAILFKTGQMLARGYQMALSGVAYSMAAIVAAGAAAVAAMRQFQAVQFAPSFSEGAINTDDPMRAASAGMKMFIDDTQMAVLGTKGLTAAFKTLNDQQQMTGQTTAVFRQLSNYTAGMGGDMEKGSQAMAKFLAQFQKDKRMTEAVKEAGKELGPGFEKILTEANKLGLNTYEKFTEAALKGELGETFKKYSGQLDALNSTVIGQFKQGFSSLKNLLVEIGEPLLGPLTKQIPRVVRIFEGLLVGIRSNVEAIGKGSLLEGLVNGFERIAMWIAKIVNRDISKAGEAINKIVSGWNTMMGFFEKIQDYLRPLVDAGLVLGRVVMNLLRAIGGKFDNSIQQLADNLVRNEESFIAFTDGFAEFFKGLSAIGKVITDVFIELLPSLGKALALFGQIFEILAKLFSPLDEIVKVIMLIAKGLDAVLNPIFSFVEKMTFGVVALKNVVQGLTAAIIAFGVAMAMSSKFRGNMMDFFDNPMTKKGMKNVGKGVKGAGKAGGRGLMGLGRGAVSMGGKIAGMFGKGGAAAGNAAAGGTAAALGGLAIIGGSAYGGSKVGGFVSDKLFNDDSVLSKTGGAAAGAISGGATGMAIGAGIGSLFGGIGAAPGAAIGAVVGSVFGGISGWVKAGKEKKAARKAAGEILKNFSEGMDDAIASGDIQGIRDAAGEAQAKLLELQSSNKYGAKEVKKREEEIKALMKQAQTADTNFSNFEAFFGDPDKLNEQIKKQGLAADSVKNEVLNIFKIMRDGGHDVSATWRGVMSEFNQKIVDARLAMFDLPLQTIEMQEKVNASQQRLLEGDTSEQSVIGFLKDSYTYALNLANGDAVKAVAIMQRGLDKAYGPGGSLEAVAGKVQEQADALKLFDPQVLTDQIVASGKLESQGRAIESITGGAIKGIDAETRMRKFLLEGGAQAGVQLDELINLGVKGSLTPDQIMMALNDSETMNTMLNTGRKYEIDKQLYDARVADKGGVAGQTPSANPGATNIGAISVNVNGFISDPATAERIAKLVQAEISKREARSGTTPVPSIAQQRK